MDAFAILCGNIIHNETVIELSHCLSVVTVRKHYASFDDEHINVVQ